MNCKRIEKYLYLLSDGHADPEQEKCALEHLQSCARCSRLFAYLQSMRHDFAREPVFAGISKNDVDRMITGSLWRRDHRFQEKPKPWSGLLNPPRLAFSFAALMLVAAGILIVPMMFRSGRLKQGGLTEATARNDQPICTAGRDSTLAIGRHCSVRLKSNSRCTIVRAEETVIRIILEEGTLLLAAKKGLYDTIAVLCSGAEVLATGTHFSVEQKNNIIRIAVLEGAVKVINATFRETAVAALEEWTFTAQGNDAVAHRLSSEKQELLTNDFAAMGAANTRRELAVAAEEVSAPKAVPGKINRQAQELADARDNAAQRQYAIAESILSEEKFETAAKVFRDYLTKYTLHTDSAWFNLGYCYTMLRRYSDAVAAYRRVATVSVDGPLMETALHRTNKILYLKLKHYDEARLGIEDYLATYPHGKWREEEWYFRVKTALAEQNLSEAELLVQRYLTEFPLACNAHELTADIEAIKHGTASRR